MQDKNTGVLRKKNIKNCAWLFSNAGTSNLFDSFENTDRRGVAETELRFYLFKIKI
ncbi:MAG: hypothetical protein JWQ14_2705 [Adhaeribacter sp.]|nr:hypothetical protein [Adhaeribacter sp.]